MKVMKGVAGALVALAAVVVLFTIIGIAEEYDYRFGKGHA